MRFSNAYFIKKYGIASELERNMTGFALTFLVGEYEKDEKDV